VVLGALLYLCKRTFKTGSNSFPVDDAFLRMWAIDAAAVAVSVAVLAFLVAEVVQSKKYFRYKYEGERGIRAVRDMSFYIYCVLLPVPFHRLVRG
jgi:uncharacterized protein YbjT (DUF2867 family)